MRVFVDGEQIWTTHNIGTRIIDDTSSIFVVGDIGSNWIYTFRGSIDEVRISKWIARTQKFDDYMYDPEWDWFSIPTKEYWD